MAKTAGQNQATSRSASGSVSANIHRMPEFIELVRALPYRERIVHYGCVAT